MPFSEAMRMKTLVAFLMSVRGASTHEEMYLSSILPEPPPPPLSYRGQGGGGDG